MPREMLRAALGAVAGGRVIPYLGAERASGHFPPLRSSFRKVDP